MARTRRTRLTMAQLADELGVSRYTVSSVVNGRARERGISQATVKRIREHLNERGYVPSRRALDLRSCPQDVVGVLHCGRLYSHLTEAFNFIIDSFTDAPQRLEIMVVPPDELEAGVHELLARGVSQLVWLLNRPLAAQQVKPAVYPYLSRVQVVIYNYYFGYGAPTDGLADHGCHLVGVDRTAGFQRLGRLIRRLGHRLVALPGGVPHTDVREWAFKEVGLTTVRTEIRAGDAPPRRRGGAAAAGIIRAMETEGATAACFYDDEEAAFAMRELNRKGVRIPEDLSVTGFDGMPFADALTPPLTTLRVPVEQMVERVRAILGREVNGAQHRIKPELVRGASLGPAPAVQGGVGRT